VGGGGEGECVWEGVGGCVGCVCRKYRGQGSAQLEEGSRWLKGGLWGVQEAGRVWSESRCSSHCKHQRTTSLLLLLLLLLLLRALLPLVVLGWGAPAGIARLGW
jgi:hypothetical protein